MSENLHNIDKLFHDSIEGYEEMPSEKVWDTIDRKLDKSNIVFTNRKYNNLKRLSVALLFLLLGVMIYEWQTKNYSGKNEAGNKNAVGDNADVLTPGKIATGENSGQQEPSIGKEKDKLQHLSGSNIPDKSDAIAKIHSSSLAAEKAVDKIKNDFLRDETAHSVNKKNKEAGLASAGEREQPDEPEYNHDAGLKNDYNKKVSFEKIKYSAHKKPISPLSDRQNSARLFQRLSGENKIDENNQDVYFEHNGRTGTKAGRPIISLKSIGLASIPGDAVISVANSIDMNDAGINQRWLLTTGLSKINLSKRKIPFHFSIMPFFSPQFNFNRIEEDDHRGGSLGRRESDEIKRDEKHQASSSWGVLIEAPLKKNWSLQTGLTYTIKNIDIEPKKIFAQLDNDGKVKYCFNLSSGYAFLSPKTTAPPVVGDSITATESSSNLRYLGIPLTLQHTLYKGKFGIIPSIGAGINFLVMQRIKTNLLSGASEEKQDISAIQGLKKTYFNTITGIALQYAISKNISLNITPSVNFSLGAINRNSAVKSYPNSFNIATGVKMQL